MAMTKKKPAAKPILSGKPKRALRPYHHGDLRASLIAATEAIILERGVNGFTLREAARRAGVSPAAPAHHFGDATGLLSEVATLGFKDFGAALRAADEAGGDPGERLYRQGIAYVKFALDNPARFLLMFREARLDPTHEGLAEAGRDSFLTLENAIRALMGLPNEGELTPEAYGALMAGWSIVHGFAHLALAGEFDAAAGARGGQGAILESFLPLALRYLPHPDATRASAKK
jgi:AcrR family transcriptional regulator